MLERRPQRTRKHRGLRLRAARRDARVEGGRALGGGELQAASTPFAFAV